MCKFATRENVGSPWFRLVYVRCLNFGFLIFSLTQDKDSETPRPRDVDSFFFIPMRDHEQALAQSAAPPHEKAGSAPLGMGPPTYTYQPTLPVYPGQQPSETLPYSASAMGAPLYPPAGGMGVPPYPTGEMGSSPYPPSGGVGANFSYIQPSAPPSYNEAVKL